MKNVDIQNVHPQLKVKKKLIKHLVEDILTCEKADSGVDVILVDDKFMLKLNREFTKRGSTTDVLSFGMRGGGPGAVEYPSLGDVYVSLDQARKQAADHKVTFQEEVALLVTHGLLHLLGYDHKDESEGSAMRKKEKTYLKKIEKLEQDK